MKKSRSIKIIKEKGLKEFIKYKKNKIYTKYERKFNINIFTPYLLKFCKPLKNDYKFILFSYGASGHWAFKSFLSYCGLKDFTLFRDNYSFYKDFKDFKEENYYIEFFCYHSLKARYKQIKYILDEKKPIIMLTRDPISRLKTMVNHGFQVLEEYGEKNELKNFDLDFKNIKTNLDRARYADKIDYNNNLKKPEISSIYFVINKEFGYNYFSNIKLIKNTNITYIDTKDLSKEKAFNTMEKLAKSFDFEKPNEKDKYKFEQKFWNDFVYLLPYRLLIDNNILIIVADENRVFLDNDENYTYIKENLIDIKKYLVDDKNKLFDKISINIQNSNWQIIQNNEILIDKLKKYFKEFMMVLEEKVNERKNNLVTEEDVLNFLKEHKDIRDKLKNILDYELQHIKENRPDIIDSWEYYQKFIKLYKE